MRPPFVCSQNEMSEGADRRASWSPFAGRPEGPEGPPKSPKSGTQLNPHEKPNCIRVQKAHRALGPQRSPFDALGSAPSAPLGTQRPVAGRLPNLRSRRPRRGAQHQYGNFFLRFAPSGRTSSYTFYRTSDVKKVRQHCIIGIEGPPGPEGPGHYIAPKSLEMISKRKFVWTELTKFWRSGAKNRIRGFILNSVNGGFAVAIAGYIAFLPKSLCINKKVFFGQWREFAIIGMNPKIANIVVKEIRGLGRP